MKKLFKNMKESEKGFTLIELIVVIAIIGILAAVLLPKFSGFTDKAREKAVLSEAKSIYTAYAACQSEKGTMTADDVKAYLGKLPKKEDGTTEMAITDLGILIPTDAAPKVMGYTTGLSGKKYDVIIKDGGEITVEAKK